MADSAGAKAILAGLRARLAAAARAGQAKGDASATDVEMLLAPGAAEGFKAASPSDSLRPSFAKSAPVPTARVTLPPRSKASVSIEDASSGTGVSFALMGSRDVAAQAAEGFVVYERAHVSGATVLHRALPEGVEDFLSFDTAPPGASVAYEVKLGEHAAGLRLVDNTLEVLDARGAPRLRVAPPYLVGADGARAGARLAVWGCQVDTNPAPPWGRAVTPPGAPSCRLEVSWEGRAVSYPALLDPSWRATTGAMSSLRHEHTATLLANGKVLVAGGRTSTGTSGSALNGLASAELFDPATRTWTGAGNMTGSTGMTGPRRLHAAVLLGATGNPTTAGKVLVAGGIHGSTTVNTASLYDPVGNSWTAAMVMNAARHQHTMTVLVDGRVLAVGGLNGTGVLNTAATYNPASGSGAWNGVTSNMPSARRAHTATRLSVPGNMTLHDKVIVVGGNSGGTTSLSTVLLFNGTNGWTTLPPLDDGTREGHAVALLPDGRLLVVGGRRVTSSLDTARIFNPATGTGSWASGGTMSTTRQNPTATALTPGVTAQGQVLVAGGWNSSGTRDTSQVYDVTAGWRTAAPMPPVQGHTATLLAGGKVLIAGGANGSTVQSASHLYDPSEGILCTTSSQCASGFCVDGVCCNSACDAGCGACNLAGSVGTCAPKPSASTCTPDGNDCTTDTCNGSSLACQHPPKSNGTTCEDGNYCTVGDTCQAGSCSNPGPLKTCAPTGQCRAAGTCDPDTGICSSPPLANGLSCSDGNRCTADDVCQMGTCLPGAWSTAMCPAGTPQFAVVTDLGVVEGEWSEAYDLNDAGEVVGYEYSPWRSTGRNLGFRYKPTGEMVPVRPDPALGQWGPASLVWSINASGTIAGGIPGGSDGFTQSSGGQVATYPLSGPLRDINDSGHVAGTYYAPHPEEGYYPGAAVRHRQPQAPSSPFDMLAAGTPFEFTGSEARAIDSSGSIVAGVYGIPLDDVPPQFRDIWRMNLRPFIHRPSEGTHDLNDDPVVLPSGWTLVGAWDMKGPFVVGQGIHDGEVRGYRYHTGDRTLVEIGTLPEHPWKTRSWAEGVNAAGSAVGYVFANNNGEAADLIAPFVYTPDGRQYDLNDFIDPASGWSLRAAHAINNQNEVAGWGFHGTSKRAFKMKLPVHVTNPTPENTITLFAHGIVEWDDDTYTAVFGYRNSSGNTWEVPPGDGNFASLNGARVQRPAPPSTFPPGVHRGAFLPRVSRGATVSWTLAGQTVSASATSPPLTKVPIGGGGYDVNIGGTPVNVRPDMSGFQATPGPVGPQGTDPAVGEILKGTLPGELTVGPTGSAIYTVPISLPPGIAGMAPNLSLVYDSQRGPGLAGQGWELAGLSTIHRCATSWLQDGSSVPVQSSVAVCLDGQRLFRQTDGSYKAEKTDFSRIEMSADGQTFTAVTKSGELRTYGRGEDSRVRDPSSSGNPGGTIYVWALARVMDQWGNYFEIKYNTDHSVRGLIVTQIDYTGHTTSRATGGSADDGEIAPFHHVTFEYGPRPDVRQVHFGPFKLPRSVLLTKIVSTRGTYTLRHKHDHVLQNSPFTPPKWPTAEEPTNPSLTPSQLWNIEYCAATGPCLEPLVFDWDAADISWEEAPAYALPPGGSQLVDLDGDGRKDYVGVEKAWKNTGSGWIEVTTGWRLPESLSDSQGRPTAFLVDLDGDGLPDLIRDNLPPDCPNEACSELPSPPIVWLNRVKQENRWVRGTGFETIPLSWRWLDFKTHDTLADMNGDGRADLIRVDKIGDDDGPVVLHSTGSGWQETGGSYSFEGDLPALGNAVQDIDRDGLADFIGPTITELGTKFFRVHRNTGNPSARLDRYSIPGHDREEFLVPKIYSHKRMGDVNGDGRYDVLTVSFPFFLGTPSETPPQIYVADGAGFSTDGTQGFLDEIEDIKPPNIFRLTPTSPPQYVLPRAHFEFALADLNADGLADLIWNRPTSAFTGKGQFFLNTGTTWRDLYGRDFWTTQNVVQGPGEGNYGISDPGPVPVPVVPTDLPGSHGNGAQFIDLDGDGVTDVLPGVGPPRLNKFRPPVIRFFPNGLARKTEVSYTVISTAAAANNATYLDSNQRNPGTTFAMAPLRVVSEMSTDSGAGPMAMRKYVYRDLRGSDSGRGPQGFASMTVLEPPEPGTTDQFGIGTRTTFAQAYPFTGLPVTVERFLPHGRGLLSVTSTRYCDVTGPDVADTSCTDHAGGTYPPGTSVFVYPYRVIDVTYLRDSTLNDGSANEIVLTETNMRFDEEGNSIRTTVTTTDAFGQKYEKKTELTYGPPISLERKTGKVTETKVTTSKLTSVEVGDEPITHTTRMAYAVVMRPAGDHFGLALTKKMVEPDAGVGVRLDAVYRYDRFGNVVVTTTCDRNFDQCSPGEADPALGFRTTSVSYNPADFVAPAGSNLITSLPPAEYHDGQFPVMTTNALGHRELSVHDPKLGVLVQQTGPNGITTCHDYDDFGQKEGQTERCGVAPLGTTIRHHKPVLGDSPPLAVAVVVTRAPATSATWTYLDALGRTIGGRVRGFDGRIVETSAGYDLLGRKVSETKPRFVGDPVYTTSWFYDALGREKRIDQELGIVDGSGAPKTSQTLIFHERWNGEGMTIRTERTVAGEARGRREKKNALGKLAKVWDATKVWNTASATMEFRYNVEGNLRDTVGPAGNVHIGYDDWGRKRLTRDPNMGEWTYVLNGYGETIVQTDAKSQADGSLPVTMDYDLLGRLVRKTDRSGTSQWVYDAGSGAAKGKLAAVVGPADVHLNTPCSIPHVTLTGGNRTGRWFSYDAFGQPIEEHECVDGNTFSTQHDYDPGSGRLLVTRYPEIGGSRLALRYNHTQFGYLQYVADAQSGGVYWAALAMNAAGQVTSERTRNGVESVSQRNPSTGWLLSSTSTARADRDSLIQSWHYGYDEGGSLRARSRSDWVSGGESQETFGYDLLNRLTSARVTTNATPPYEVTESYGYDSIGNLTAKAGTMYSYTGCLAGTRPAGPHAVCSVTGSGLFSYDANGNVLAGNGRTVDYNASNKPTQIAGVPGGPGGDAGGRVRFAYGADGNRVLQTVADTNGVELERTIYVGMGATGKSLYERTVRGGTVEHVQFLYAGSSHGGSAFALRIVTDTGVTAPTTATKYHHLDHLGSVTAMSDDTGYVPDAVSAGVAAGAIGYDAWGARRSPSGRAAPSGSFPQPVARRGFTGHESIPRVGLVNMNGRVYDPALGRFLSPDPNVQFADDLQSYNRYSYVQNNPLSYTDPTGYFLSGFFDAWVNITLTVAGIGVCAGTGFAGCGIAFSIALAVYNSSSALAAGASLNQVIIGTAIGMVAGQFGGLYGSAVSSALGGGAAGQIIGGAVSAAVSSMISSAAMGGGISGKSLLFAAAQGASASAMSWAASLPPNVSQKNRRGSGPGSTLALESSHPSQTTNDAGPSPNDDGLSDSGMQPVSLRNGKTAASCAVSSVCREAYRQALSVDLSTDDGEAVFWTGGRSAQNAATAYAAEIGGYTEEMRLRASSRGQSLLNTLKGDQLTVDQKVAIWRVVSARFALGASGDTNVFLTTLTDKNSVYYKVERPILLTKQTLGMVTLNENIVIDPTIRF